MREAKRQTKAQLLIRIGNILDMKMYSLVR